MRFSSFARRRPDGRHYSGPATSASRPFTLRVATGVLGLAMAASLGAGGVVSASLPAQASTPEATVSATDPASPGGTSTEAGNTPAELADGATPTEGAAPEGDTAPTEGSVPTGNATPTETPAPAVDDADPAVGAAPADDVTPVDVEESPAAIPAGSLPTVDAPAEAPSTPTKSDPAPAKGAEIPETAKEPLKIQALAAPKEQLTCSAGVVYTIGDDKKIRRVNTSTGGQTDIGTITSSNPLNGLALTKDANHAYAVRSAPVPERRGGTLWNPVYYPSYMTVYGYDSAAGTTTEYDVMEGISEGGTFVMGGINPATGIYYYGRVLNSKLELYAFNTATNSSIGLVGSVGVSNDSNRTARGNGDLVFSSDGTMYFVASSGGSADDANALMQVTQQLPTTSGNALLPATLVTNLQVKNQAFNGIAFEGGYLYLDTTAGRLYKVDPSTGNLVGGGAITSSLSSPVDMASCQYNNSLKVQKNIVGRVAGTDQFTMTATADGAPIGAPGTTTGAATGVQTGPGTFASSVPISGTTIRIEETGASGTNLAQYTANWACRNEAGTTIFNGSGTSGTFTFPAQSGSGVNVTCIFTNQPLSAQVSVTKTWVNAVAGDTANFSANAEAGTSTAPTNGSVITAGFAQGTTVNVAEVLASANKGVYATALKCTNAAGTTVAEGELTGTFTLGASNVTCAFINTNTAATVVVEKKWIVDGLAYNNGEQPEGISAASTLTGPGAAGATAQNWGAVRSGYFAGNTVTIAETTTFAPPLACTLTSSALTLANGTTTSDPVPHTGTLAPGANSYTVTNTVDCQTKLTLLKVIDSSNGGGLVPGDFILSATPAAGTAWEVPGADAVTSLNTQPVVAGADYTISESSADKPAYLQLSLQRYTGTLNSDGSLADPDAWTAAGSTSVSVATGHHEVYRFVNASAPAFALPLTGGTGSSPYMLVGGGLILLAILTGLWIVARRIKSNRT